MVQPSGKYDDRPGLVAMLARLEQGDIDTVLFWDLDRMGRHLRVLGTVANSLDIAARNRGSYKPEVEILETSKSSSPVNRVYLVIMIGLAQEENEKRARRIREGKIATLEQGLWPGTYNRLGYAYDETHKGRGKKIILGQASEVETVKKIFGWYDSGVGAREIRSRLLAGEHAQRGWTHSAGKRHEWTDTVIRQILRADDYTGQATWYFNDGTPPMSIPIPQIITPEQFSRVQKRLDKGRRDSRRNTNGVYLLQSLLYCGDCGGKCMARKPPQYFYNRLDDGSISRGEYKTEQRHRYRCHNAVRHPDEGHARPFEWQGEDLDAAVWRYIADNVIEHPELVLRQVQSRQAELKAQGEDLDGDIARLRRRLAELEQERLNTTRQLNRGKIEESHYDVLIAEIEGEENEAKDELSRLLELRDDAQKVKAGMEYAERFLINLQARLPEIDQTPEELKFMPESRRLAILAERQKIIGSLCSRVMIYADGRVDIDGMIDAGTVQFVIGDSETSGRGR